MTFFLKNTWKWAVVVVLLIVVGVLVWVGQKKITEKVTVPKSSQEETSVVHDLGPIEGECLYLPDGIDPYHSLRYRGGPGPDILETFVYGGEVSGFSVDTINQEGVDCKFYVISLTRIGKTQEIFLPWNLKSIPSDSNSQIGDSDGQILQQLRGQRIELTIQFQKEGEKRKFFSWKVEVL